jgi:excisionase family DNA binding protein
VTDTSNLQEGTIDPIFVSVSQAAKALNISEWVCYKLIKDDKIRSAKHGTRRLVYVDSLREYADSLGRTA